MGMPISSERRVNTEARFTFFSFREAGSLVSPYKLSIGHQSLPMITLSCQFSGTGKEVSATIFSSPASESTSPASTAIHNDFFFMANPLFFYFIPGRSPVKASVFLSFCLFSSQSVGTVAPTRLGRMELVRHPAFFRRFS